MFCRKFATAKRNCKIKKTTRQQATAIATLQVTTKIHMDKTWMTGASSIKVSQFEMVCIVR
jgi:hypothetical protein